MIIKISIYDKDNYLLYTALDKTSPKTLFNSQKYFNSWRTHSLVWYKDRVQRISFNIHQGLYARILNTFFKTFPKTIMSDQRRS